MALPIPRWLGGARGRSIGPSGELVAKAASSAPLAVWTFNTTLHEPFTGAWQRHVQADDASNVLAFSAVYACIGLIADDVAKMRIKLVRKQESGVWKEENNPAYTPVLRKPNRYQTRIQFVQHWITSKLIAGNTYVLKERDNRGVVRALYILDPRLVLPLVTPAGDIYYQLGVDPLAGVSNDRPVVPASEIIHDRMITMYHPLIGVTPIYACGRSATQGNRIQANSAMFFQNMSRPSGVLTAPGKISDETAKRLKQQVEESTSGGNIGRLLVAGDGLDYKQMTMSAEDSQLIEQLKWTVEDVARCFKVPGHKLGILQPTFNNVGTLNQDYYSHTLQTHIEAIELLLDEGLALDPEDKDGALGTEFDLDGLMRMDPAGVADVNSKGIAAGYLKPNEARLRENMEPVDGGDTPYMQQQNWSLASLEQRPPPDAKNGPTPVALSIIAASPVAPVAPPPADDPEPDERDITAHLWLARRTILPPLLPAS